jgi:serine/threonine-protein kinase
MHTITCSPHRLRALAALACVAGVLHPAGARAQAEDQATARVLFNEGRRLMKAGQYDQACPKLEAASRLYVGSGVLLNLADCYEHVGRTASAWTEFGEAASAASRTGRSDDQAEALRRQAAVEPRLSRLVVRVAPAAPSDLVVKRDGIVLDHAAWGTAIPVDPGAHSITAEASGRDTWSTTAQVAEAGKTLTVDVPELKATAAASAKPPVGSSTAPIVEASAPATPVATDAAGGAPPYWTGRRIVGVAMAGVGLAALGVGGILGLTAKSQYNTAAGETGAPRHTDSQSAYDAGNVATIVVGVGGAVAAAGLVLWLTAPSAAPSASPQVGTDGRQVLVRGSF